MGALTRQFEGISKAKFEAMLRDAKGGVQEFIRRVATDEEGRYHDPETQRFWAEEEQRELGSGANNNDGDSWDAWNSWLARQPTGGRDG